MREQSYRPYKTMDILSLDVEQSHILLIPLLEYIIVIETAIFTKIQVTEMKLALICESQFWHILRDTWVLNQICAYLFNI